MGHIAFISNFPKRKFKRQLQWAAVKTQPVTFHLWLCLLALVMDGRQEPPCSRAGRVRYNPQQLWRQTGELHNPLTGEFNRDLCRQKPSRWALFDVAQGVLARVTLHVLVQPLPGNNVTSDSLIGRSHGNALQLMRLRWRLQLDYITGFLLFLFLRWVSGTDRSELVVLPCAGPTANQLQVML